MTAELFGREGQRLRQQKFGFQLGRRPMLYLAIQTAPPALQLFTDLLLELGFGLQKPVIWGRP